MEKIDVLLVNPAKKPYKITIEPTLENLDKLLDGFIEVVYPFDDDPTTCIVCNDSGKINGMLPNRAIYDKHGNMTDIIWGQFLVCNGDNDNLTGLSLDGFKTYMKKFLYPEELRYKHGHITMEKFDPDKARIVEA